MVKRPETRKARDARHARVRKKISGTPECPRLSVFRSLQHIYAQLIDDAASYACAIYECNLLYIRDGMSEEYKNGENQWGVKKSVAAELRPKYTTVYQNIIKQLACLLPSEDEKAVAQELMEFIRG